MAVVSSLVIILLSVTFLTSATASYNVVSYGAKPDGRTDSAKAFQSAWSAACGSAKSASIIVPAGQFLISQATFQGPCKNNAIRILIAGTLVAPAGYSSATNWLLFKYVQGVSIFGGTIDGRGQAFWACKTAGRSCPQGATVFHITIFASSGIKIQGAKITAPGNSPNTDGIHIQRSSGVTVLSSTIGTGDDCISMGEGAANVWIQKINCGPGHGISIGSLGGTPSEAGVQNITVTSSVFTGTQNGVRVKTWGKPYAGYVRGVTFSHLVMQNVQNPIVVDQNYCPGNVNCPGQSSGVKISQVSYTDIRGSSATPVAVKFDCSPSNPCKGMKLRDINLSYLNKQAQAFCRHAHGSSSGTMNPRACPDGRTDAARPFLAAWAAACGANKPATIIVPAGRFLVSQALFTGPCKNTALRIFIQGTLLAPSGYIDATLWITFKYVEGLSVYGGTLDGRGQAFWACKKAGRSCPYGATSLTVGQSKNVLLSGMTLINSELFHMSIYASNGVTVKGARITAPGDSPNTDGIHVQMSSFVTITESTMRTGDDCISMGAGSTDVWIEKISCGPGHGISIGSLGGSTQDEAGVQNITVRSAAFTGTQNGVRIKTWGRPVKGYVKGVNFEHVVMNNVQNPIVIDQNYCPGNINCPGQSSGIEISDVKFADVQGSSATQVAVKLDCSPSNPCIGIGLNDIKLSYQSKLQASSYCKNAKGVPPFPPPPALNLTGRDTKQDKSTLILRQEHLAPTVGLSKAYLPTMVGTRSQVIAAACQHQRPDGDDCLQPGDTETTRRDALVPAHLPPKEPQQRINDIWKQKTNV
ncbi:polygalacturonase-like protein [Canna indica]|uniref:Exopolygalacturonase n=1 Tax=Canna indica TaxID=4628 RepID=A0AAQ3QJ26_9LILI|nr:polygalacturonase-like protein [Canna indica]